MKIESSSPFLSDQKMEGKYAPSHALFSQCHLIEIFEIVILFNRVEKFKNMSLMVTWSPAALGEGLRVVKFPHC